jgi:hypothetical protein
MKNNFILLKARRFFFFFFTLFLLLCVYKTQLEKIFKQIKKKYQI